MKIIICYASAGAGHLKAAQAIYDYLKKNCPKAKLALVDVLDQATPIFRLGYALGYTFLVSYATFLWAVVFYLTSRKPFSLLSRKLISVVNRLNTLKFRGLLIREDPDYFISTHFLCSEIAGYLKIRQKIKSKVITVITDFGIHPFWVSEGVDFYTVACGKSKQGLLREGIEENKILEIGIPVELKFLNKMNRPDLCVRLGIERDMFTVLVTTGSFGIGPIEEIVGQLQGEAQILVVCARNKVLLNRLSQKKYKDVRIFGFVENMHELMAVSDIIITKPGGLSIAEILTRELLPIFICPIPGQETANSRILNDYGIGLSLKKVSHIKEAVLDYKTHPQKIMQTQERMRKIQKPFASRELCDVICQGGSGSCC